MFLAHIQILAHIQNKYNTFWSVKNFQYKVNENREVRESESG